MNQLIPFSNYVKMFMFFIWIKADYDEIQLHYDIFLLIYSTTMQNDISYVYCAIVLFAFFTLFVLPFDVFINI